MVTKTEFLLKNRFPVDFEVAQGIIVITIRDN